eukprot:scaffold6834_cov83-Cylindrotheca_fusiformis.AAC.4
MSHRRVSFFLSTSVLRSMFPLERKTDREEKQSRRKERRRSMTRGTTTTTTSVVVVASRKTSGDEFEICSIIWPALEMSPSQPILESRLGQSTSSLSGNPFIVLAIPTTTMVASVVYGVFVSKGGLPTFIGAAAFATTTTL